MTTILHLLLIYSYSCSYCIKAHVSVCICNSRFHCHIFVLVLKINNNSQDYLSHVMIKFDFCICENKATDQLHANHAADQGLCFRYIDSIIPLLPKSEISSH